MRLAISKPHFKKDVEIALALLVEHWIEDAEVVLSHKNNIDSARALCSFTIL